MPHTRRSFLAASAAAVTSALAGPTWSLAAEPRRPRILLRSSWQTVNIGDIAHTPGVLALIEKHIPAAEVRLWPSKVDNGVEEMLARRFPKVPIVKGPDAIKAAFAECDFLLHGSGPSLVAANDVARWRKETGKPYGIYGITIPPAPGALTVELIDAARFAFFRDGVSLKVARDKCECPVMEFGPDGAFAVDLRNDEAATTFLKENGLEEGKFMCCIPRLRYTPYWKIHNKVMTEEDQRKHKLNEEKKGPDHALLRATIVALVQQAKMKVLVCPEDQSQMAVGKEMLVDPLPEGVKKSVVWREKFWLTDEALSTYVRSAGLFGNEMHSPIMCIGNGVPAVVCRWAEQTSKGFMWRDIGLGDWLFDTDVERELYEVPNAVLKIAEDPKGARAKVEDAQKVVRKRQAETMKVLADQLPA